MDHPLTWGCRQATACKHDDILASLCAVYEVLHRHSGPEGTGREVSSITRPKMSWLSHNFVFLYMWLFPMPLVPLSEQLLNILQRRANARWWYASPLPELHLYSAVKVLVQGAAAGASSRGQLPLCALTWRDELI